MNKDFNNFDNHFNSVEKTIKRGFGVILIIWVAWVLFVITALCALGYVAWHFISKFW